MEPRVARIRIRSVKFKSGGEIRLLRLPDPEDARRFAENRAKKVIDAYQGLVAGFAFVVWGADGGSTALVSVNEASNIPSIMVPDFVRNRLLAERIEAWTLDTLAGGE